MIPPGSPAHHMKKYLLCVLILLAPAALRAQDSVRIDRVGMGSDEIFNSGFPTPVRVHIPALPQTQTLELQFRFAAAREYYVPSREKGPFLPLPHRILKEVKVSAGVPLDIDVPVSLPGESYLELRLVVADNSGHKIGETTRKLNSQWLGPDHLVAIFCANETVCNEASSQILGSIAREDQASRWTRLIETLREPLEHWWEYVPADAVVIAGPTGNLTSAQREALEEYLRGGGTLILLEKEMADATFLSPYRQGSRIPGHLNVGTGWLFRLQSTDSKELLTNFKWGVGPSNSDYNISSVPARNEYNYFLQRLGITFVFPELRWLIIWLGAFIVAVGPINFFVLHRLKRLEWGWVTTCVISVLFAGGLYFANSVHRPTDFTLDDTVIYRMDSQSPMSLAQYAFRVYSPERRSVSLVFSHDDALLRAEWDRTYGETAASIGSEMLGNRNPSLVGWEEKLGPPQQIEFPMLRWSFQDFQARSFRVFPGTVHWTSPMHLKNDTGQDFREAIYLDFAANQQFLIPHVSAGEEIDLTGIRPSAITYSEEEKKKLPKEVRQMMEWNLQYATGQSRRPFSVAEIAYAGIPFSRDRNFVGWIDDPAPNAKLDMLFVSRRRGALVMVALDKQ
jgi:hypothetical protein